MSKKMNQVKQVITREELGKKALDLTIETLSQINALNAKVDNNHDMAMTKTDNNHNEIMAALKKLLATNTPVQQPVTPQASVRQPVHAPYKKSASEKSPIATCEVYDHRKKAWVQSDVYAYCSDCKSVILSPSVVAYCEAHGQEVRCYACQKGKKSTTAFRHLKPVLAVPDMSITVACDICGTSRRYKDVATYNQKKASAIANGLPGTLCIACAKEAAEKLHVEKTLKEDKSLSALSTAHMRGDAHAFDYLSVEAEMRKDKAEARKNKQEEVTSQQEVVTLSVEDVVGILLADGLDEAGIKALKFAELKKQFKDLAFNGNEWNKNKVATFNALSVVIAEPCNETPQAEDVATFTYQAPPADENGFVTPLF